MTERPNTFIYLLYGYLDCLRRLCGPRHGFFTSSYKAESEIDDFVAEYIQGQRQGDEYVPPKDMTYSGKAAIEYRPLMADIASLVFDGLLGDGQTTNTEQLEKARDLILWDIPEYFGLAASQLKEGSRNPLVDGPVYRLYIRCPEFERALYFIVRIEDTYVFTGLIKYRQ
jgi:hypothetical protein